ncbi:disulfide bond formation protein DsbA [Rhodobacterales bacterium 59_46_T64]|nr:disulfide bond formation protein DsbA [Rhodobacterales bacterium 59_46_T64]
MTRPFSAVLTSALLMATPAFSFDINNMSRAETEAFGAEVRAYLMENPQVIMDAVNTLEERQAAAQAQSDVDMVAVNAKDIFENPTSWVGGNLDGDITLVEFTDYRCGYCRKAVADVEKLIKTDGNIRFIIKEFPILGEASVASSRFAIAVRMLHGDDAYKNAHDALIAHKGGVGDASLTKIARKLDLEAAPLLEKMNSDEVTQVIADNHALAQRLQISGTPTFVLEDRMLRGYVPFDGMQQLVAEARKD